MKQNIRRAGIAHLVILGLGAVAPRLARAAAAGDAATVPGPSSPEASRAVAAADADTDADADLEDRETSSLDRAIAAGALLPLTLSPAVGAVPATAVGYAGYDGGRGSAVAQAFAEVRLWRRVALRGGTELSDTTHRVRPSVGARLQVISQQRHGADGAVSVSYRAEGFNQPEGEIETVVAIGRRFGRAALFANLAYGQDFEGHERDGELRLAALARVTNRMQVGVDGRWRLDLGSQTAKLQASNEPTYDIDAGPVLALSVGPMAVVAHAGASIVRRVGQDAVLGLIGVAGVGASF